jgi:hypothetical protein
MRRIDPTSDWTALVPGLFLAGIGTGLVNPPLASTAVGVVEPARSGMASGINSTFRQVGIATGIATFGSLFASKVTDEVSKGLAGAPPGAADGLSKAVKNGAGQQAIAGLPEQLRATAAQVARESFVMGLRQILLIAALVALVGGVLALALIRRRDFVGAGGQGSGKSIDGPATPPATPPTADTPTAGTPAAGPYPTAELPVASAAATGQAADPHSSDHGSRPTLHGWVEHTDGRPFEGVPLTVTSSDGEPVGLVHSGADGRFALQVPPGSCIVIASPEGCQPDARRVLVPDDGDSEPVEFVLDGDGLIYGRVLGATDGVLAVLDASGSVVGGSDLEDDGSYEIAGLRSGTYTLAVLIPGTAPVAHQVDVLPGDAREYDIGLGPADLGSVDPESHEAHGFDASSPEPAGGSLFGPGLHPVAMVRGGTSITGLPVNGSANGHGVASADPREED